MGFPLLAVVLPVVAAVTIGLITGSAFVIVFALLSPIIAIATMIDGRRTARRHQREEAERFDRECDAFSAAITAAHAAERLRDDTRWPRTGLAATPDTAVRVGVGPRPSDLMVESPLLAGQSEPERRLAGLLRRAAVNPTRALLVARGEVRVAGVGRAAEALTARLALEPGVRLVPEGESPPSGVAIPVIRVHSALRMEVVAADGTVLTGRPELLSAAELAACAGRLPSDADQLPLRVAWRDLAGVSTPGGHDPPQTEAELDAQADAVPVACAAGPEGPRAVALTLPTEGPHLLVGGTTGSGKSEFLRTLAVGWAAARSPAQLQLLFVDFKGGATFADLLALPHVAGLITDLDPLVAERTLLALRAELRRRERILVDHGIRDAAQAPDLLPRLAVLVDEFAALIETFPDLHAVFADLSARGRSLGVHLVLGTQHPAAVVRDAVAANCALRIAFRLPEAAGAAFVGPSGRSLAAAPPGRALIVGPDGETPVQVAVVDDDDIARAVERWVGHPGPPDPWLPPLPETVSADDLACLPIPPDDERGDPAAALAFGLVDDPAELRRLAATWNPGATGALAVIGCAGSGRSSALAALAHAAHAAGRAVVVLPRTLPGAWERLEHLVAAPFAAPLAQSSAPHPPAPASSIGRPLGPLLVADDLDLLVGEAGDRGHELLALWDTAVRALRAQGGGAAAALGPASASRAIIAARFGERLLLRALDADDHALAGAPRGLFDRCAPPGRGWWRDRQVQVVAPPSALVPEPGVAALWQPPDDRPTVVIAASTGSAVARLQVAYPSWRVVPATDPAAGEPPSIMVAHPDAWQGAWSTLAELRRRSPVLAIGVGAAELRMLLGIRAVPPPVATESGECWLIEPDGGPPRRVGLPSPAAPHDTQH